MRKVFPLMLAVCIVLGVAACGSSNINKANGKWICDGKATGALGQIVDGSHIDISPERLAIIDSFYMEIDVPLHIVKLSLGEMGATAPFTVISDEGDTLILEVQGGRMDITFDGDDGFVMRYGSPPNVALVFNRQK